MNTPSQTQNTSLDPREYEVLKEWYLESSKILKQIATLSFVSIGFFSTFLGSDRTRDADITHWVYDPIILTFIGLGLGAVLASAGIATSYWWYENLTRLYHPNLAKKLTFKEGSLSRGKRISNLTLFLTLAAPAAMLLGWGFLVSVVISEYVGS